MLGMNSVVEAKANENVCEGTNSVAQRLFVIFRIFPFSHQIMF